MTVTSARPGGPSLPPCGYSRCRGTRPWRTPSPAGDGGSLRAGELAGAALPGTLERVRRVIDSLERPAVHMLAGSHQRQQRVLEFEGFSRPLSVEFVPAPIRPGWAARAGDSAARRRAKPPS